MMLYVLIYIIIYVYICIYFYICVSVSECNWNYHSTIFLFFV